MPADRRRGDRAAPRSGEDPRTPHRPGQPEDGVSDADLAMLKDATGNALIWTLAGDSERAADEIERIVALGAWAVHSALCGWSGVSLHGFAVSQDGTPPDGGLWAPQVTDLRSGELVSVDQLGDPSAADAFRLVACVGNGDHDTIAAITSAAIDRGPEALASLLAASLRLAAAVAVHLRRRRETRP